VLATGKWRKTLLKEEIWANSNAPLRQEAAMRIA